MSFTRWLMETDDGSLSRGRAYAREGRVDLVRQSDFGLSAVVRGTTSYDVSVSGQHAVCTCPVGAAGRVCKHVVAVVLAAEDDPVALDQPTSAPSQLAQVTTPLSPNEMQKLVDGLRTRGYLDYRRANENGERAHRVVDRLESAFDEESADAMRPLLERAAATMIRTILRSDDSSGAQSGATRRLFDLHAKSSRLGSPDPLKLARWLGRITFGDDGFFALDPVEYADPLGERGLAAYRHEPRPNVPRIRGTPTAPG